ESWSYSSSPHAKEVGVFECPFCWCRSLTGESSGIVDNLAGASVFVLSSGYSRDAEIQADAFAREAMLKIYGDTKPMAEMFELFRNQSYEELPEWLSTHPDLDKRIKAAKGN
ncbi:peptidase, partial [Vibrio campbellii CAIM 519 = NBRC 15631 = ATCC 25920]